jgi:hypothetical protein
MSKVLQLSLAQQRGGRDAQAAEPGVEVAGLVEMEAVVMGAAEHRGADVLREALAACREREGGVG